MPGRNPFRGRGLHNEEEPRETGMGARDVRVWFDELVQLQSPILGEFHWLSLLSGLRRNHLATLRWTDVSIRQRAMTVRAPKGGKNGALGHRCLLPWCGRFAARASLGA